MVFVFFGEEGIEHHRPEKEVGKHGKEENAQKKKRNMAIPDRASDAEEEAAQGKRGGAL